MSRVGIRGSTSRSAACSRGARCRESAARATRGPAHARALPLRPACGGARGLPPRPPPARDGARGLEPGLALRRIELEILRQEPSLSLLDHGYEWREAVATC